MSPPGTYDTPGWGELLEPPATMTPVSDADKLGLTELEEGIAVMTSLADGSFGPSYTELTDSIFKSTAIPDSVDDYSQSAAGMWDWVFMLLTWDNIGNTWSGSWKVSQPNLPTG